MLKLNVKGKEYKLKFGYKSFKKSGILKEVISMQRRLSGAAENEADDLEALEEVFELNSKLVLAALQKYHEEFRADYSKPESLQSCIDKVDDFMDDYMDEEDSMSIMDLFNTLAEELFNNGFLSKKTETEQTPETAEAAENNVIPIETTA